MNYIKVTFFNIWIWANLVVFWSLKGSPGIKEVEKFINSYGFEFLRKTTDEINIKLTPYVYRPYIWSSEGSEK